MIGILIAFVVIVSLLPLDGQAKQYIFLVALLVAMLAVLQGFGLLPRWR